MDLVVIGGGLAGACAALAARAAGRTVTVVRRAPGRTALSPGTVDFAAGPEHELHPPETVGEACVELARARPRHPYALLGERLAAAVDEAIRFLRESFGLQGASGADARNLLLATPFGTLKATALAQAGIAAGDLREMGAGERVGVVELPGCGAFPVGIAAAGLDAELRRRGSMGRAIAFPADVYRRRADAFLMSFDVAAALDGESAREQLAEGLARRAKEIEVTRVLLPVAGLNDAAGTFARLRERTGLAAAEMPGAPPSVPGLRLQRLIDERLRAAGVTLRDGTVLGPGTARDGALASVRVGADPREEEVEASAFVLATGRFIGGGIAHREGRFSETVFDLPVYADGRPATVYIKNLLGVWPENDHAAMRAGVRADARLRPLDAEGRPPYENLFAAGDVLGGHDPARDKSGLGVAAVTGLLAGRAAT